MADWYTVDTARAAWAGAPMDDDVLQNLLDASKEAVLAYAPALPAPVDPEPVSLTLPTPDETNGAGVIVGTVDFSRTGSIVTATFTIGAVGGFGQAVYYDLIPDEFAAPVDSITDHVSPVALVRVGAWPDEGTALLPYVSVEAEDSPGGITTVQWITGSDAEGGIPQGWAMAHLLQARNIWNATRVDPAGSYGTETFQIAAFPLDWQVRQLIRPKRAVPVVG